MKIQSTKSYVSFGRSAFLNGRGLGNLYKNLGTKRTEEFLSKITNAAKQIQGKEFYFLNKSQIIGDIITLKGKYANEKSVEKFSVALNLKANEKVIQNEFEKETKKLKLIDVFDS